MHFKITGALAASAFASTVLAFDASSSKNVAVYWGQGSYQIDLSTVCSDESVDIVNLAFVNQFPLSVGDYPATNFANACGEDFYAYKNGTLSGLRSHCPSIAPGIQTCHDNGKKVLLSVGGGWPTDYYLPSTDIAKYFAEFLYGAFGPATSEWIAAGKPRPFGNDVAVDGFDLDLEAYISPAPTGHADYQYANYDAFVNHLKTLDSSLLISGAPQCLVPDTRMADAISNSPFDFVYVQFYNTPLCSSRAGYNGLSDPSKSTFTFDDWVAFLKTSSKNSGVKIYLGLPAGTDGAPSDPTSYLTPAEAHKLISYYSSKNANIFGGVMLWEATVSSNNKICNKPYHSWIKDILTGYYTAPTCASTTSSVASSTTVTASTTSSSIFTTPTASSPDGSCGGATGYTCIGNHNGECCSQWGYCGSSSGYCDAGCQAPFGKCGSSSSSSISSTTSSASSSSSSVSSSASSSISSSSSYSATSVSSSHSSSASSSPASTSHSSSASGSSASSSHSSSASTTTSSSSSSYSHSSSSSTPSSSSYSVGSSSSSSTSSSSVYPTGSSSIAYPSGSTTSSAYYPTRSSSIPYPTGNATTPCTTSTSSSSIIYPGSSSSTETPSIVYPASSSSTPCTTSTGSSNIDYPASSSSTMIHSTGSSSIIYPASSSSTFCTTSTASSSIEYSGSSSLSMVYPTGGSSNVYPTTTGAPYPPYPTTGYYNTTKPCTSSSSSSIKYPGYSSSSGEGYSASSSSKQPGYSVPSSSSKGPSYPATTEKPIGYSHSSGTKTVYTTSYVDICSTGFTTKYTTVTTTSHPEATPKANDVPEGWYTTVTVCTHCAAYPTTVTLTKPVTVTETEYVKPTGFGYAPGPSSAYPEESKPYPSAPAPGKPYPEAPEKATSVAISATSTVYEYVTLTKVPIPASMAYPAGTPSPAPYVPVAGEPSPAPYGAGNGTTVTYPSGTATGSVPHGTYAPVEFEGAANRIQVGVSAVAVVLAAFLAL